MGGRGVGVEEVKGDGGVDVPPISLITSSDWLFGRSAAVNTPVSAKTCARRRTRARVQLLTAGSYLSRTANLRCLQRDDLLAGSDKS